MHVEIRKGLTLEFPGAPEQIIHDAPPVTRAGCLGAEYRDIKPVLAVSAGATVAAGDPLFTDRRHPELRVTSPIAGRITDIVWGPKRSLTSVLIDATGPDTASKFIFHPKSLGALHADEIRLTLMQSGLWSALRARPFSAIPTATEQPRAMFVSLVDTQPWAADPAVVLAGRESQLDVGIRVLSRLTERLYLCKRPQLTLDPIGASNVHVVDVSGPHPAGLPGTQIEHLAPVTLDRAAWYIGYQDVLAIGELFSSGRLTSERVISVAGPGVKRPRLLRTHVGASIEQLLAGEVDPQSRIVVGSIFYGRATTPNTAFIGRYDTQLSVLPVAPAATRIDAVGPPAMLPLEVFEAIWPFASPPLALLRALLAGDTETAEALGSLGLDEEDLALCAHVCPASIDYGGPLRGVLDTLQAGA
jgi:Na+-transporting NADH:ubiquinone oxidoreductase subunit A